MRRCVLCERGQRSPGDRLCYVPAWNGRVGLLQTLAVIKKPCPLQVHSDIHGEGWTLPVESEASRRACAICRFPEHRSTQKCTINLTPPSAEHPLSFQGGKMRQPEEGKRWRLLLVYSDSQCVGGSVWGI